MAYSGGKGGGGYGAGMGAGAGYGGGCSPGLGYGASMGKAGGNYPLALAGAGNNGLYSGGGKAGMTPYGPGGMIGSGSAQPYMGSMGSQGANGMPGGMNIAVIVQNTMGTYAFFVGADGSAGMSVPGASFMYTPNGAINSSSPMQYGNSIDSLLGKGYNPRGMDGPGMEGYNPLKNQIADLKDFGQADYKMRDPSYASNRIPDNNARSGNNRAMQDGVMKKNPKDRYAQMGKAAGAKADDYSSYGRKEKAMPRQTGNSGEQADQMRPASQLEKVAMAYLQTAIAPFR